MQVVSGSHQNFIVLNDRQCYKNDSNDVVSVCTDNISYFSAFLYGGTFPSMTVQN
jgi:hypothetical protein